MINENEQVSRKEYLKMREKYRQLKIKYDLLKDEKNSVRNLNKAIRILERSKKSVLNQQEAAQALGVSIETFRNWRRLGIVEEHQVGGRLFFIISELIDLIKRN